MANISAHDKEQIMEKAQFLIDKGYALECYKESIMKLSNGLLRFTKSIMKLSNGLLRFTIGYSRYDDTSIISVSFLRENEVFYINWLSTLMDKGEKTSPYDELKHILYLLDFTEKNYDKVTNIEFCKGKDEEIKEYVQKHFKKE